jgi:dihydrofolate reductase
MSLDGFVANTDHEVGMLHAWFWNGDQPVRPPGYRSTFRMTKVSSENWQTTADEAGAFVCGRRTFDLTGGWWGDPPLGVPTFVVTHRKAPEIWADATSVPFTFVTDGVESAVDLAKDAAGPGTVHVAGADIAQQCLRLGLLDEVMIDLVPVLFGEGIRLFDGLNSSGMRIEERSITHGVGVTHLRYALKYRPWEAVPTM